MYAVIKTGGKQYKISEGDKIKIEKIDGKIGETVKLKDVLIVSSDNKTVEAGKPFLEGATITAKILDQDKDKKVTAFRYKPKKRVRIKRGHRQMFTVVEIVKINHKQKESLA